MKLWQTFLCILNCFIMILITGCGNNSSTEPPPPPENIAPVVSVSAVTVDEKSSVTIQAEASDSDGEISEINWTQKSGVTVELLNADSESVMLTAPAVTENQEVVLTVTVTDDDGATASADTLVTINANILTVTLQGLVTDSPIPEAIVSVNVGDEVITTTADETGAYAIEINLDDSYVDQMVTVTALGAEQNSPVKLVSLLGDFGSLESVASEDGLVTKNQLFGVNVTNVSTALAALMEDVNEESPISNSEEFIAASNEINSTLLLPLATAIKLVIDYSGENPDLALPDGASDTLALVSNIELASEYVSYAIAQAPESYNAALAAILSDPEVISSLADNSAIPIADNYFFMPFSGTGDRITLNEDGSGEISELTSGASFSWLLGESGVDIDFGPEGWTQSVFFTTLEDFSQAETHFIITDKNIKWIAQSQTHDQLLIKNTFHLHYPNGERADTPPSSWQYVASAVKSAGLISPLDAILIDNNFSMGMTTAQGVVENPTNYFSSFDVFAKTMVFTGDEASGGEVVIQEPVLDGQGSVAYELVTHTWSITPDGHLSIVGEGVDADVVFFEQGGDKTPAINFQNNLGTGKSSVSYPGFAEEMSWDDTNVLGIFDLGWNFFSSLQYFWIENYADGTGLQISTLDIDSDGELSAEEFFIIPTRWQFNSEGNIVIRRYRYHYLSGMFGFCNPGTWETLDDDDCQLYNEREWDLYHISASGEYSMRHLHRFFLDYSRVETDPTGHLLWWATTDNRSWQKVAERPVAIPDSILLENNSKNTSIVGNKDASNREADIQALVAKEMEIENTNRVKKNR